MPKLNLSGMVFGNLTALNPTSKRTRLGLIIWECRCVCGSIVEVSGANLKKKNGGTRSCGCLQKEAARTNGRIGLRHGHTAGGKNTKTYEIWRGMRKRCEVSTTEQFQNYGGRGIKVCEEWKIFENFLSDMGECPPSLEIDRIDVNGNYEPSNCRWATKEQNQNNKRNSLYIEFDGQKMTIAQWARKTKIDRGTLYFRYKNGWPTEKMLGLKVDATGSAV